MLAILLCGCLRPTSSKVDSISPIDKSKNSFLFTDTSIFQNDTVLSFLSFSMLVPSGWRNANDDTIPRINDATFRKRLHNKNNKLVYIITGLGSWDVTDAADTKPEIYKRSYQKLTGFKAMWFEPCCKMKGYHGVFIDSIGQIAGYAAGLCIYSENLSQVENSELKSVINSIKIKTDAFR